MQNAQIIWKTDAQGNTVPTSAQFDDVYFSHAHGLSESRYVFAQHNRLHERFADCIANQHAFVIGETGFGTGLNFLMVCALWASLAQNTQTRARLHFISTEQYPLSQDDLQKALHTWRYDSTLVPWIDELLTCYPLPLGGCHRRILGNNLGLTVILDLWLGDATDSLQILQKQPSTPKIDAWFLDGFAPKNNSALWSDAIFDAILALSKPQTTLATFSAAATVKNQLTRIGATFCKVPGFGKKRHMLTAHFSHTQSTLKTPPKKVLVVGAGVSGLLTAYALAKRGVFVQIIDQNAPLSGASGNPRALLSVKLGNIQDSAHNFALHSFLYAYPFYQTLNAQADAPIFAQTGAVDFMLPTQKSAQKLYAIATPYPKSLIIPQNTPPHALFSAEFSQKFWAYMPPAGIVNPQKLCAYVLSLPNVQFMQHTISPTHITKQSTPYDAVVVCAGHNSHTVSDALFKCRQIRGQVSYIQDKTLARTFNSIGASVKYDGYACSFDDTVLFGASFVRNCTDTHISKKDHQFNIQKLRATLPAIGDTINPAQLSGRAAIRAQTPDYHPIVGHIHGKLWANYGYGSKGFTFAPLCGELMASLLCGEALPIDTAMLDKISPKRTRLQTPLDEHT